MSEPSNSRSSPLVPIGTERGVAVRVGNGVDVAVARGVVGVAVASGFVVALGMLCVTGATGICVAAWPLDAGVLAGRVVVKGAPPVDVQVIVGVLVSLALPNATKERSGVLLMTKKLNKQRANPTRNAGTSTLCVLSEKGLRGIATATGVGLVTKPASATNSLTSIFSGVTATVRHADCNCLRNSTAVPWRSSGFFPNAFSMTCSMTSGKSGLSVRGDSGF
jgi:hypothetical protein